MSPRTIRAALLAVAASGALLAGCEGGSTGAGGGCDPNGVKLFQPEHCRGVDQLAEVSGDPATYEQLADLAGGAFPRSERATAVAVAMAESSGRLDVISDPNGNGTRDHCAWQINDGAWGDVFDIDRLTSDPAYCADAANEVRERQGWGAWTVVDSGSYRRYLAEARAAVSS